MSVPRRAASLLCLCLLVPRGAAAQDLLRARGSATQTALAGAGVVAVQGADALWVNPAGLPGSGWQVTATLGLEHVDRSIDLDPREVNVEAPPRARNLRGVGLVPALAVTAPVSQNITVALGYHTGLRLGTDLLSDHALRYLGSRLEVRQHLVSLGIGYRWRWLAVGATIELSHLRLEARRTLWAGLQDDRDRLLDPDMDLSAAFSGHDGAALTGLLGLRLRPLRWLELGMILRPPMTGVLEGTLRLQLASETPRPPADFDGIDTRPGPATLELDLPLEVRAGLSLRPRPWLALHLEARLARWSRTTAPQIVSGTAAVILSETTHPPAQSSVRPVGRIPLGIALDDRWSFHTGLELPGLLGLITLRVGYAYHLGASRAALPSAYLLDLDHHTLGVGAEAARGSLRFGLAVRHCFPAGMRTDGAEATVVNPLDPTVTEPVGGGRFASSLTRVVFTLGVIW